MDSFTFGHLADCHLGSWRDPQLRQVGIDSFCEAIDACIKQKVAFILISGDLFNTALPSIETLRVAVAKLQDAKRQGIPIYLIAGSHDYSPAGKTMLHILEEAEIIINVLKGNIENDILHLQFTIDPKTGAKICGILGRAQSLEKKHYQMLDREPLEKEEGFKIFMFHSAIQELKPADLGDTMSAPLSLLPKNFNYYAGGHVHYRFNEVLSGYGRIVYPGPTFPNSFSELEKLDCGSFVIATVENGEVNATHELILRHPIVKTSLDCSNLAPKQVEDTLLEFIEKNVVERAIILLRLHGTLYEGSIADISFKAVFDAAMRKGALSVLKNTHGLDSKVFERISVNTEKTQDIEHTIIEEHMGQIAFPGESESHAVKELMTILDTEKGDGETVKDFEQRLIKDMNKVFRFV